MALDFGFYDSYNGDRRYNAAQMSGVFEGLINDGVYAGVGNTFAVTPGTGLQVIVGTGRAWIKATWNKNPAPEPLDLDNPDPAYSRIDIIAIKVNKRDDVRENKLIVYKGNVMVSPVPPLFPTEEDIYYLPLAYVTVRAKAERITAADIEILVGKTQCPYVTSILQQTDISVLFAKWEKQFNDWWTDIKAILNDNAVTELTNRINERVKIADLATDAEAKAGTSNTKWMSPAKVKLAISPESHGVGYILCDPSLTSPPANYLRCDGSYYKASDYPELFKKIGLSYVDTFEYVGGQNTPSDIYRHDDQFGSGTSGSLRAITMFGCAGFGLPGYACLSATLYRYNDRTFYSFSGENATGYIAVRSAISAYDRRTFDGGTGRPSANGFISKEGPAMADCFFNWEALDNATRLYLVNMEVINYPSGNSYAESSVYETNTYFKSVGGCHVTTTDIFVAVGTAQSKSASGGNVRILKGTFGASATTPLKLMIDTIGTFGEGNPPIIIGGKIFWRDSSGAYKGYRLDYNFPDILLPEATYDRIKNCRFRTSLDYKTVLAIENKSFVESDTIQLTRIDIGTSTTVTVKNYTIKIDRKDLLYDASSRWSSAPGYTLPVDYPMVIMDKDSKNIIVSYINYDRDIKIRQYTDTPSFTNMDVPPYHMKVRIFAGVSLDGSSEIKLSPVNDVAISDSGDSLCYNSTYYHGLIALSIDRAGFGPAYTSKGAGIYTIFEAIRNINISGGYEEVSYRSFVLGRVLKTTLNSSSTDLAFAVPKMGLGSVPNANSGYFIKAK